MKETMAPLYEDWQSRLVIVRNPFASQPAMKETTVVGPYLASLGLSGSGLTSNAIVARPSK
jgi:hypothetical protein